jgi:hypothetical protein
VIGITLAPLDFGAIVPLLSTGRGCAANTR